MSDTATRTTTLRVGETVLFNFPAAPGGKGTFLGWTDFGWIILDVYNQREDEYQVKYYNLANLNTITPESDPRV